MTIANLVAWDPTVRTVKWTHILERRYEFSQTTAPGQLITNLLPTPDLWINGPYALCGKCHSLSVILANSSFSDMRAISTMGSPARRAIRRMAWAS